MAPWRTTLPSSRIAYRRPSRKPMALSKHRVPGAKSTFRIAQRTLMPQDGDWCLKSFFCSKHHAWLLKRRSERSANNGIAFRIDADWLKSSLREIVPFELTAAQKRTIAEISQDLTSGQTMNRLLQGDVGSGKTVVGLAAMLMAVENGFQAALMAPTEIRWPSSMQSC